MSQRREEILSGGGDMDGQSAPVDPIEQAARSGHRAVALWQGAVTTPPGAHRRPESAHLLLRDPDRVELAPPKYKAKLPNSPMA